VREVTLAGMQTRASRRRPPRWPLAALRNGLVMQGSRLELWDPASGRITQRLPGVFPVASRDWRLVSCAAGCRVLHVSDTLRGTRGVIEPAPGTRFTESYDGAFSPDGRLVAVPARDRHGTPRVAIVDLAHRTAMLVRGPRLARAYPLMAWSQSGWLFYNAGHGRLAAYNPLGVVARLLAVHVGPFVDIAAR
jgi:sugar lactone lactonase YvrE